MADRPRPSVRRASDDSWLRRRAPELGLATDLVAGAVLVLGAYLFTGEVLVDDGDLVHPGFVLVCSASFGWGALRSLLGWVTTDARPAEQSGRRRAPRRTPRRVGPSGRARWVLLVAAVVLATFLGGLTIPDEPDAGGGVLVGGGLTLFVGLLGTLIGVGALLILGAMALTALGVWTFGTVAWVSVRSSPVSVSWPCR